MRVELLYFPGCPNVEGARLQLRRAFAELGLKPEWSEVDVTAAGVPSRLLGYGSPTILVDGGDVARGSSPQGSACRIYLGSDVAGMPPLASIVQALTPPPK